MLLAIGSLVLGLVVLTAGGHYLVEGATRVALRARISATVVGLTVVALGTSMPELAVSLGAAIRGSTDISYANVVGSNIFNVAAVLAITALIFPIPVRGQTLKLEYPFMVIVLVAGLILAGDGAIDRIEGVFFLVALTAFFVFLIRLSRAAPPDEDTRAFADQLGAPARLEGAKHLVASVAMVAVGIVALAAGAELMVRGAVTMAERFGVTERIIGLTVVAGGTSLPELTASLTAAYKGRPGIALGNVVGSNIFNMLCVLGTTAIFVPIPVAAESVQIDNWVMVGTALLLFFFLALGKRLNRLEGGILLIVFLGYMGYLVGTA